VSNSKKPRKVTHTDLEGVGRFYQTPIGSLPSVTTILASTKTPESAAALEAWRERIGRTEAATHTMRAAERGTRVHNAIEAMLNGEPHEHFLEPDDAPLFSSFALALARVARAKRLWTETTLWHPLGFAGTADCVVDDGFELVLHDWKTSSRSKRREWIGDYFCQVGAYSLAFEHIHGEPIARAEITIGTSRVSDVHRLSHGQLRAWQRRFVRRLLAFKVNSPAV